MKFLIGFSGVFTGGMSHGYATEVGARLGIPAELFEKHLKAKESGFLQACRGRVSEEEFFADLAESWNRKHFERWELMGQDLRDVLYDISQRPIEGAVDILARVAYYPERPGKGGRVLDGLPKFHLVEDQTAELASMLYQWHPDVYWLTEDEFWSFKVGLVKRDPFYFQLVMRTLGGAPEEYLLVDSVEANLEEARRAGIATIQFTNPEQLMSELSRYGFTFMD